MDFLQVLKKRHATRNFKEEEVENKLIVKIVEAAQTAPSWNNSQPWRVYVAKGAILENIKTSYLNQEQLGQEKYFDIPLMPNSEWNIFPATNMNNWFSELNNYLGKEEQAGSAISNLTTVLNFAPVIAFITVPRNSSSWTMIDLGAFSQTLMLAAANYGLDSLISHGSVRYPNVLRKFLPIGEDEIVCLGIELGYAKEDSKINTYRSTRLPVKDILTISE